ncbi:MAG: SufE family protein [Sphingobacteriales bacterium JAD_PAG50586_3]|nr:MAG: SufE family protein [Sphingobacteriales bacterium JAD_PAG50586_3]
MKIEDIENEIIEEFQLFDDEFSKYEYLVEVGKALPLINEKYKTAEYEITGCQSKVWLNAELIEGKVVYSADSTGIIPKGIVSLLLRMLSGQTPEDIVNADPVSLFSKIGISELSMTRSNGLRSMAKQMKLYALAFQAQGKWIIYGSDCNC